MSDTVFRIYGTDELGPDGYPLAWRQLEFEVPVVRGMLAGYGIKDVVRAQAGHRCIRCGHPYECGKHGTGEWTTCDAQCNHGGRVRIVRDGIPVSVEGHDCEWINVAGILEHESGRAQVEARWRILTVHHLDGDKANCCWWNLAALCQRCHLQIQGKVIMARVFPWDHSDWFKPYAAGFYAFQYLEENLTRGEVEARMDELLELGKRESAIERMPL